MDEIQNQGHPDKRPVFSECCSHVKICRQVVRHGQVENCCQQCAAFTRQGLEPQIGSQTRTDRCDRSRYAKLMQSGWIVVENWTQQACQKVWSRRIEEEDRTAQSSVHLHQPTRIKIAGPQLL